MNAGIELVDLEAGYGGEPVVRLSALSIEPGTCLWLQGRNGSGKSTLLKALVGLADVYCGHARIDGAEIDPRSTQAIRNGSIWYLPQKELMFENLAPHQHVTLIADARDFALSDVKTRALKLLDEFGLSTSLKLNAQSRELSFGQRKAIALALGLCARPRALLLDEPFAGLSGDYAIVAERVLRAAMSDEGATIMLVEHQIDVAARLSTRRALIEDGLVTVTA